jgi:DNA-binding MarR family transcriptional regulator
MNQDIQLSREQRGKAVRQLVDSLRASQTATDILDEAFCDFLGINRTDGRCLDVVDRHGQVTAGELAKEVGLTTGAVTAMVDRLEAAELLQRGRDPGDRRKVLIELTPEAKKLASDIYGQMAHATAPFIDTLTDSDLLTLIAFFDASRRVNLELAETVRHRSGGRKANLRYRIEAAKSLKEDAKDLFKTLKADMKGLVSVVIVSGGSRWELSEEGKWVEVSGADEKRA